MILALGFGVFLLYAGTGYMSIDSAQQLGEARAGVYTDWHPPMMARLWHVLEWFVQGPSLMLLAQSLALLVGLNLLLRRAFAPRLAALITVAVFLFPPVVAPMAVIWKDSQMAGYLVLGFALFFSARRSMRVLGVAFVTLGCAMRYNAPAATLPLFLCAFEWRENQRRVVRLAIALAVWLASTGAATLINKALPATPSYTWYAAIAPYDIVGTLAHARAYKDADLNELLAGTPIQIHDHIALTARRLYSPVTWWPVSNGPGRMFDWPENAAHRAALARAWKRLVFDNPRAYIEHRLAVFQQILGISPEPLYAAVWTDEPSEDYQTSLDLYSPPNEVQREFAAGMHWLTEHTSLFRPYLYVLLALLLLPLARRHLDVLGMLASGLLYELTFLPLGAPDVRYSHWLVVMTILAAILLYRRRAAVRATIAGADPASVGRLSALDLVRGLGAVAVACSVVTHALRLRSMHHPDFFLAYVFFLMSGASMALAPPRPFVIMAAWRSFVVARVRRLAPLWVAVSVAGAILGVIFGLSPGQSSGESLVSSPVAWVLAIEVGFYLVFPLLLVVLSAPRGGWLALVLLAIQLVVVNLTVDAQHLAASTQLPSYIGLFAVGIWLGLARQRGQRAAIRGWWGWAGALVLTVLLAAPRTATAAASLLGLHGALISVGCCALVALVLWLELPPRLHRATRWFAELGYPLFLVHPLVLVTLDRPELLGTRASDHGALFVAIVVALSSGLAYVMVRCDSRRVRSIRA